MDSVADGEAASKQYLLQKKNGGLELKRKGYKEYHTEAMFYSYQNPFKSMREYLRGRNISSEDIAFDSNINLLERLQLELKSSFDLGPDDRT